MYIMCAINFICAGVFGYSAQQLDDKGPSWVAYLLAGIMTANAIMFALNA